VKRKLSIIIASPALVLLLALTGSAQGKLMGGVGKTDITPPVGTPLAGYGARRGKPSTGVHDPTEARALVLDNGSEKIALVSVDHLGFDHGMVERIRALASEAAHIAPDHIFVMSSHTHSGGGAFMEMLPPLANALAGKFDPKIRAVYEQRTAEAIITANRSLSPVRIGFGAGEARGISRFRSSWPPNGPVDPEVGVIRVDSAVTRKPLAVLMNFAAHPTVLGADNMSFSADFAGYARNALEKMIGGDVMAIFANGAQGTIAPNAFAGDDGWQRAENVGTILAAEVFKVALMIKTQDSVEIRLARRPLTLKIVPTSIFPPMMAYPPGYESEINAISFDNRVAFVAIPGELGSILNFQVKERGKLLGFEKTFILGLTNDALGYIISEDEYRHRTYESTISLFGPTFGSFIVNESFQLLEKLRPVEKRGKRNEPPIQLRDRAMNSILSVLSDLPLVGFPAPAINPSLQTPSRELPAEEGPNQNREGDQSPAQAGINSQRDDQRHRQMNRENPLSRELSDPCPPVAEGQVEYEHDCRYSPHAHTEFARCLATSLD
jgi:hypothetical protein